MKYLMTYKEILLNTFAKIAKDKKIIFIGYNTRVGKAGGTLNNVSEKQLLEMPLAENLMAGLATGMALKGYKPILYFERFDFITNALDCIVNQVDKINKVSRGEFSANLIIRCVVGRKSKPFFTGLTHTQDFSEAVGNLVSFPVVSLYDKNIIFNSYLEAYNNLSKHSTILVEFQDYYDR